MTSGERSTAFSTEVGARLRAVRRARKMSLDDVERVSRGRWTASAVGAYERGFRNLSLPRLRALAEFYGVAMALLVGEADVEGRLTAPKSSNGAVVLDLTALAEAKADEAMRLDRFVRRIILDRGDFNGRVLSIRRDDVRALCALVDADEDVLRDRLREWGALVEGPVHHTA